MSLACGVIYLVPVPIGNLGDITLRALEILKQSSLIACEDTRKTAFLLSQYDIPKPRLLSFHKFNERQREEQLLTHLTQGNDLTVVSDAGSPGISDPSAKLVTSAIAKGIKIIALPGATALIPAITSSGMDTGQFQFLGFLPTPATKRKAKLQELARYQYPSVIYEAPHRLPGTLHELLEACGDRRISIAREISKLHEEHLQGMISDFVDNEELVLKGEFVLVLQGCIPQEPELPTRDELTALVARLQSRGLKTREISAEISQVYGISRSEAYHMVLNAGKSQP